MIQNLARKFYFEIEFQNERNSLLYLLTIFRPFVFVQTERGR